MKRDMICIICPRGCAMTAEVCGDKVSVTGHSCPRGEEYAINECLHPVRTVTATIRVANRKDTMVSVKTASPVAKGDMMQVMAALRAITVSAPVAMGDVLLQNVCGADVIATENVY